MPYTVPLDDLTYTQQQEFDNFVSGLLTQPSDQTVQVPPGAQSLGAATRNPMGGFSDTAQPPSSGAADADVPVPPRAQSIGAQARAVNQAVQADVAGQPWSGVVRPDTPMAVYQGPFTPYGQPQGVQPVSAQYGGSRPPEDRAVLDQPATPPPPPADLSGAQDSVLLTPSAPSPAATSPTSASVPPAAPAPSPSLPSTPGSGAGRPSQFGLGLSYQDALAFCGPVAAMTLAQRYGNNIPVEAAKQAAIQNGWDPKHGMAGVETEHALLGAMGVPNKVEYQVDWNHVTQDVQNGNPVIVSTPGHYYYIDGVDPETGSYHVGTSGTDLKGGTEYMTPERMQTLMGKANGALYVDNPTTPGPSIASQPQAGLSQTTVGMSGGQSTTADPQGLLGVGARAASWLGDQGQKALQAILVTEGGMTGQSGDNGQSHGPLQFYSGGQLANFARQAGMSLADAASYVTAHPQEAIQWAIGTPDQPGYLGAAIQRGLQQGLQGADLATFAQRVGQVSKAPERAGQNFLALFGNGQDVIGSAAQSIPVVGPAVQPVMQGVQDLTSQFDQHVSSLLGGSQQQQPTQPQMVDLTTPSSSTQPAVIGQQDQQQPQSVWDRLGQGISDLFKNTLGNVLSVNQNDQSPQAQLAGAGVQPAPEPYIQPGLTTPQQTIAARTAGLQTAAQANEARQQYFPSPLDPNHPANVMQEMQDRYGQGPAGLIDQSRMTPEDRARYQNALLAVGGVTSGAPLEAGGLRALTGGASDAVPGVLGGTSSRFFHGTGGDFARPEPGRFDPNGLFGPGYYLTDNPQVAGGVVGGGETVPFPDFPGAGIQTTPGEVMARGYAQQRPGTPNVRAVDVPNDLKLLNADAPIGIDGAAALNRVTNGRVGFQPTDNGGEARQAISEFLWPTTLSTDRPAAINKVLADAGYDGIQYAGGQRVPMLDATGREIEHNALVIFPQSLDKLRNAVSGTQGGFAAAPFASTLGGAAAGGAAGYQLESSTEPPGMTDQQRLIARAGAAGAGAIVGGAAGYGAGRLLGRGGAAAEGDLPPTAGIVRPPAPNAANPPIQLPVEVPHGLTVRLEKYPEDVQKVITAAYNAAPDTMDVARRGVIPDQVVQDLADLTGTKVDQIVSRWKPGQAVNAETMYALRRALATESQNVVDAQQALRANPGSLDAQSAMMQSLERQYQVQQVVTGATAEAGRSLRQFRMDVTPLSAAEQSAQQMQRNTEMLQRMAGKLNMSREELAQHLVDVDLSDPVQVANLARNLQETNWTDKLSALWYFNLLSSPVSHIRNVLSNTVVALTAPLETGAAAGLDVARVGVSRALGMDVSREVFAGEVPAEYVGLISGLRNGVEQGIQVLAHGFSTEEAAGQLAGRAARKEPLGPVFAMPGRALGAEDAVFRTADRTAALYGIAYRNAAQEGLRGSALLDRTAELVKNPTAPMLNEAQTIGTYRVFQQDGELTRKLGQAIDAMPLGRFIMPFHRTPLNIAMYALERTPAGLIGLGVKAAKGGLTARDAELGFARMGIGTALMGALYSQAQSGNLTGALPQDPAERDAFLRQGKQPYSVRVGGTWYSYQALQPFSTMFAAAAAIHDAQQKGALLDPGPAAVLLGGSVAKEMVDMPWTQGLADALEFIHDPTKMASTYAEQQARSVAPGAAFWRWVARATDAMVRDPNGPVESVLAGLPIASQTVQPKLDAFGRPVVRPQEQMGLGSLNPFSPTPEKPDPVEAALNNLQIRGFQVEPGFVGRTQTVLGQPVQISVEQQRQKQQVSGQLAYALLLPMVTDPGWASVPDEAKRRAITTVLDRTRNYADKQLAPELAGAAVGGIQREQQTGLRRPVTVQGGPGIGAAVRDEQQAQQAQTGEEPLRLPAFRAPAAVR